MAKSSGGGGGGGKGKGGGGGGKGQSNSPSLSPAESSQADRMNRSFQQATPAQKAQLKEETLRRIAALEEQIRGIDARVSRARNAKIGSKDYIGQSGIDRQQRIKTENESALRVLKEVASKM